MLVIRWSASWKCRSKLDAGGVAPGEICIRGLERYPGLFPMHDSCDRHAEEALGSAEGYPNRGVSCLSLRIVRSHIYPIPAISLPGLTPVLVICSPVVSPRLLRSSCWWYACNVHFQGEMVCETGLSFALSDINWCGGHHFELGSAPQIYI